ncbi:FHA domain-containing protein [Nocardioides sp. Bht2]|uniref:FHA domain-containing protein n=1 Tax=Nocardioides sp. Bht2 TaxID=3392297 RepID=UPI0039B3AB30
MSSIRVQAEGRTYTFDGSRPIRLGRDPRADVVLTGATVSRQHAELQPTRDGWQVVDSGSTHGVWLNGQRLQQAALSGTQTLFFGQSGEATPVQVTVEPIGARPTAPPPASALTQELAMTVVPGRASSPGTMAPALLVRSRDLDRRFAPLAPVRIGREPGLEVVADDPVVSRQHALLEPRPDGWWLHDRSTTGTFLDGERVRSQRLDKPTTVLLGHPTAGYELEIVPMVAAEIASRAIAGRKRRRTLSIVGAVLGALLLIGGGITAGIMLSNNDDDGGSDRLTAAELDRAKAASVLLIAMDENDRPMHSGSGSVISSDGLILTNAHVGKPSAPGQGASEFGDPAYLLVALTQTADDKPAEPTYRAEPIVADGYLDLAVLKINADAEGNDVDNNNLSLPAPLPVGSSQELRTGDEITALGYPGIGNPSAGAERPLTVTRGIVSTFQADPVIGTERGFIDSDLRLGSGNSGGASINSDGELIGINTAVITAVSQDVGAITQGSALIRPIDLANDVMKIAKTGGDPDYVSPFADRAPAAPDAPKEASVTAAGWSTTGTSGCTGTSSLREPQSMSVTPGTTVHAEFAVEGLPDGLPIGVTFVAPDGVTVLGQVQDTWKGGTERQCVSLPFTAEEGQSGVNAVFVVGTEGETAAENPLLFQ